jgi:hypothetical protein
MEEQALDFISKTTGLSPDKIELKSEQKDPAYDFILATTGKGYIAPTGPAKSSGYNDALDSATRSFNLSNIYTDSLESYGKYGIALNPYSDWNEERAQRQSTFDKWVNGLTKAGITTVGAVTENTLGVLAGLGSLAAGGSYYDNFIGRGIDNVNDWAQTNLPNYYTQAEQNAGVLEGMGTANFWADKVANGVGYSLGSIATMWLGTGELGLAAKGIGKVASIGSKAAKAVGIAGKTGAILEDAALLGSKQLAMYRAGKAIETGAKLERMAGIARFSTAAERLAVATQMSLAEASVEARETKSRFIEEQTAKWKEENPGQEVPEDIMNGIMESANAAGNTAFAINLPILATSNLIMFRNMFRGANVGERAIYNLERTAADPAKWAQSMGDGKLAKAFTNAGRIFNKPLTGMVTEGFQEGSQFAASEFSRDYYGSKFNDGFGDMSKSISQSLSATFGTKEGLENMLIGAIVGGGTGAVSRIAGADSKLAKERTANSEKALEALNSGGLAKLMQTMEQNNYNVRRVNIMEQAQKMMSNPESTSSQKMQAKQAFERAQTQLIRSEARRYSKMGALDYFLEQLDDAKAMPEKEFKEAFGFDVSIPLLDQAGKSQVEIVDDVRKTVELSEKRALQVEAILARTRPKTTLIPKLMESLQSDKTKNNKHIQGIVRSMYANMLHERLLDIDVLDNQIDDTYRELEKLSPAIAQMGMEEFVYQMNVGNINVSEDGKIAIRSGSTIKADKKLASQLNEIYTAKKRLNPADSMEFRDVALGLAELLKSREIAATAMDNLSRNPEEMDLVMQYEYVKKQEEAKQASAEMAAQVISGAETADEIRNNLPDDASPEMIAEAEARIAALEEEESIARASMSQMTDEELEAVNEDEIPPTSVSALAKEKEERENAERIRQQQRSIDPTQIELVVSPQQTPNTASYVDTVERMQEVSDAEEAALGDIFISAGGKIFTINGTTYLNLAENPTDAIIYDENGERIGVELTDAATGINVTWKLSEENEEDSAIVDSTTYAILLNAASIRSDEAMAAQSNAEALAILEIRGEAAIEDVLEKQNKEIEAAQERAKGKLKNFELTQSQEDFEAFEKEQSEVAKLVATTNLGETEGMTDGQIRTQIEVIKQDLIEFYEILDAERKIALSENPNLTQKEFNERPSVITVKAIAKTHEALFQKKVEELRKRKQAAKTITEEAPAPAKIEEVVPQNEIDELLQSTQNKINRLENEIAEFAKYADEYQKMVDGTYPGQNVEWAAAKLKKLNAKIATRKATIQKEKDLIQRINDERESEKLRQASNAPEGTSTTTEGEESEATDLNPRAGSTEEGMDGTTTDEELEIIRQRFEEQSKFEDEDPANFEEPEDPTGLEDNDVALSVEGPMDIQLVVGAVTPGKNPDGTNNWNITIVGSTGNSTSRLPVLETDGKPISMYPEYLSDSIETPVNTTVIFRVDEKSDWWNSEDPDPKYKNNKKDLTEDNYWKHVPIYMVIVRPNGTEEIVALLQAANDESGASRRDIYELYKKDLTPSATILGKKFNKSNIANARTQEGQTFFYPASSIAGENPVIAVVTQKDMMPVWTASTTDENVAITIESASADNVTLGQVAIVVPNPEGTPTVIVASTKDMTPEGATKAIDYIIADEPQAELYSEIVGVNRLPVNIENEEDTIKIEGQTEDPFSERFIATNRLTDGTELFSFYSKSANAIVRLNAEELKKALLGQPFRFSFSEAAPNERGWVELRTVKKPDVAYKAVENNLAQEFRDITMKKKFQVALGSMMNKQQYVSPISGKTYNSYFEYLSSTEEFSEPRTEGLGANAILTVDTLANNQGSPFHDVGVKLSQLTTLEEDVKTEEEMELKQVVASTTTNTVPQPAAPAASENKPAATTIKITSSPSKSSPMLKGEIITPDGKGNFTVKVLEDGTAYIYDIQLGDFQESDKTKNKGYGLQAYIQIGQEVQKLGYTLESTHWDKHTAGISPQALRVWEKLVEKGYAEVTGTTESKVYNRETGEEEVKTINVYQFKKPATTTSTDAKADIIQTNEPTIQTIGNITFGTANKQGQNDNNEDAVYVDAQNGIFILADGMGGEGMITLSPAQASRLVINKLLGKTEKNLNELLYEEYLKNPDITNDEVLAVLQKNGINLTGASATIPSKIVNAFRTREDLGVRKGFRSGATALKALRTGTNTYTIEKIGDTVFFVVDKDGKVKQKHGLSDVATTQGYMFSIRDGKPYASTPKTDNFTITLNEGETLVLSTDFIETDKAIQDFINSNFGKNLDFAKFQKENKTDDSTFITIKYDAELTAKESKPTAPAVVEVPVTPKVTSSSQVIADDLSLLTNLSRTEEKPVSSTKKTLKRDAAATAAAAAVAASEKAAVKGQTEELNKALGEPMSDLGALTAAEKARIGREAATAKGEQTKENDCLDINYGILSKHKFKRVERFSICSR